MIKSQPPHIISSNLTETSATWRLRIDETLPYFNGHFRNQPVLPGVTQLDWAIQLGCAHFQYPIHATTLEVLKFQNVITPGIEVNLSITLDTKKHKLSFVYSNQQTRFSSGRIVISTQRPLIAS
ncbi:thioester dehydrase [uncultured Shewanella sp.]|uniref:ApeI family dehydratase n=1 Tax=uncultured Shewanella sp. TaxID=173975 RepID=UPI002603E3A1|nr:thioester dehydrase [uncultured Shewanella sp.]